MTFIEAVKSGFKNIFKYKGRASRSEFWWFVLFELLFWLILSCFFIIPILVGVFGYIIIIPNIISIVIFILYIISIVIFFFCSLSLTIRRLHDKDLSGWWTLLFLIGFIIPYINIIVGCIYDILMARPGTQANNRFGPNPNTTPQVMTLKEAIKTVIAKKFNYKGRASRAEFWWFMLVNSIIFFIIYITFKIILLNLNVNSYYMYILFMIKFGTLYSTVGETIVLILGLIIIMSLAICTIPLSVRRLHDKNMSGWWCLLFFILNFIPLINIISSLVFTIIVARPGTSGDNRFGPDPLKQNEQQSMPATITS